MVDGRVIEFTDQIGNPQPGKSSEQDLRAHVDRLQTVIKSLISDVSFKKDDEFMAKAFALGRIKDLVSTIAVAAREYLFALPQETVDTITLQELIKKIPDRLRRGVGQELLTKIADHPLVGDPVEVMMKIGLSGNEQSSVDGLLRKNFLGEPDGDSYYFGLLQNLLAY